MFVHDPGNKFLFINQTYHVMLSTNSLQWKLNLVRKFFVFGKETFTLKMFLKAHSVNGCGFLVEMRPMIVFFRWDVKTENMQSEVYHTIWYYKSCTPTSGDWEK